MKNTRTKWHKVRHTTNRLAEYTTKHQRVRLTQGSNYSPQVKIGPAQGLTCFTQPHIGKKL